MAATTTAKILIIGGGLGGLCLAQGLQKARIPFHVYERDPGADYRAQGYRLRINGEGVNALRSVLSPELFDRFEKTCATVVLGETDINAADGSIVASRAGGGPAMHGLAPSTCDRKVLREILLTGLEGSISFGKELVDVDDTRGSDAGGVVARFSDGSCATGRFLVGADGRGSPTRRLVHPGRRPLDTEGLCIYGKTVITPELLERLPAPAMRWMTLIVDRTPITHTLDVDDTPVTLLLEPIRFARNSDDAFDKYKPDDYVYWVLIARKQFFGIADDVALSSFDGDAVKALSLRITECWEPHLRSILHLQDKNQSSLLRVLSADPDMAAWEPSDKTTLIGDAIHMMSPCGGVGAVSALVDGANLAQTIATEGISARSIGEFEAGMRHFSGAMIRRSYIGGRKMFGQAPFDKCREFNL